MIIGDGHRPAGRADFAKGEVSPRQLIDSLVAFVGVLALDGTLLEANDSALDAAGLRADEVVGRPFWEAHWWSWSADEQRRLRDAIERAGAGLTVRYDAVIRLRDEARIVIDFQLAPLHGAGGVVTHLVPSGIDVTDRRDAEGLINSIIAAAPIGFAQLDREMRFVRINDELAAMNGIPPHAHIGRLPWDLLPGLAKETITAPLGAALRGEVVEEELVGWTPADPQRERAWLERFYPLRNGSGEIVGAGVFALEVTERRESERRREQEVRALQQSLLPTAIPRLERLEVAAGYTAASDTLDVGGDFYEVLSGSFGGAAIIGDVCGRGAEAAALTATARYTLIPIIEQNHDSPARALRELNRVICEHHEPTTRFVTVAVAMLRRHGDDVRARVALAGHPHPVVVRSDGTVDRVGVAGSLIGIDLAVEVVDAEVRLGPGDALVLFTDGYTEARDEHGRMLGEAGLEGALGAAASHGVDEMIAAADRAVAAHLGERGSTDDRAILALRVAPA